MQFATMQLFYLLYLNGELPGGGEAEDLGLPYCGVDALQDRHGECGGFPRAGLRLRDHVSPLDDRFNSALLDRARLLKPVRVYPPEKHENNITIK